MNRFEIDKRAVRRAFEQAAPRYDEYAVLQQEVERRLLERLDYVRLQPRRVLDVGAGTGAGTAALAKRYRKARVVGLDLAYGMLARARRRSPWYRKAGFVVGDAESLPVADASCDLVFSNLTLQWCNELPRVFAEVRRVLCPGGLFLFTTFGPDTLAELRACWSQVDGHVHVSAFPDMHDVGDALVRAGLADPVMDTERFTLTYGTADQLMRELKLIGAHNAARHRAPGLTGKGRLGAVREAYEAYRCDGTLPASYEVVYGHGWMPQRGPGGAVEVPLGDLSGGRD
jgi:malonyl-CoA O-methyltransferase